MPAEVLDLHAAAPAHFLETHARVELRHLDEVLGELFDQTGRKLFADDVLVSELLDFAVVLVHVEADVHEQLVDALDFLDVLVDPFVDEFRLFAVLARVQLEPALSLTTDLFLGDFDLGRSDVHGAVVGQGETQIGHSHPSHF